MDGIKVGIQGGPASFNEQAVLTYLGRNHVKQYKIIYLYTTENVLQNLSKNTIDYGLFAIENSLGGIVKESEEAMQKFSFTSVDKISIPIRHFLMKRKDIATSALTTIMAHPQVFLQCNETLHKNYPHLIQTVGVGNLIDTATAAKSLAEGLLPKTVAILGPAKIAETYNFDIIDSNLQDKADNITTFLVVKN